MSLTLHKFPTAKKDNSVFAMFIKQLLSASSINDSREIFFSSYFVGNTKHFFVVACHYWTENDFQSKIASSDSFLLHFVPCYKKMFPISCLAYYFIIYQISAPIALVSFFQPTAPLFACKDIAK